MAQFNDVEEARAEVREHLKVARRDRAALNVLHDYLEGNQQSPSVPDRGADDELRRLARMSRVNIMDLVVSSVSQALYVDGFRGTQANDDAPAWAVWQQNRMDARQTAVHRAALAYGVSYVSAMPRQDGRIVIEGHSPRRMVALYEVEDDEWPRSALQILDAYEGYLVRLYDDTNIWEFFAPTAKAVSDLFSPNRQLEFTREFRHGSANVPVVRFTNVLDLESEHRGEIERLIPIQDQIDDTTFNLLVAQRFAAFRQRWIIGWTTEDENAKLKSGVSRLWTFEDAPEDVKVGEFEQTDLGGYLESRESSLRHAATISQTPAHELIGQMVNLSAEALVAAEASQRRKVTERQVAFGESWEQVLRLAGQLGGFTEDDSAQVRWRDTESRALSQTVDALGKMAQSLGVPPQALWERIPGVTQQDIERWKLEMQSLDPLASLQSMLEGQEGEEAGSEPQDLALNGAQISSLLTVMQQVTTGQLGPETARALLSVSFPSLSAEEINRMVNSAMGFTPSSPVEV